MKLKTANSYVYILINKRRNVMYVGYTDDLKKRIYFHKKRLISGFTRKYNVDQLVYYESFNSKQEALKRESQIKKYKRCKKDELVAKMNPKMKDLYDQISG